MRLERAAIAVLVVTVVAMAATLKTQYSKIRHLEQAVAEASAPARRPMSTSMDLQGKCSEQARKFFSDRGFATNDMAGYENHYNADMNRCFVQITNLDTKTTPKVIWTFWNVFDAFEGKEYGVYAWHTVEGKKYWEVEPFQCEVTLPSGEKRNCHSDEEFTQLVSVYMAEPARTRPN